MNRSLVFDLATAAFIARHEDSLFVGPYCGSTCGPSDRARGEKGRIQGSANNPLEPRMSIGDCYPVRAKSKQSGEIPMP